MSVTLLNKYYNIFRFLCSGTGPFQIRFTWVLVIARFSGKFKDVRPVVFTRPIYDTPPDSCGAHVGSDFFQTVPKARVVQMVVSVEEGCHAECTAWSSIRWLAASRKDAGELSGSLICSVGAW